MSQQAGVLDITFKASVDLRSYQYRAVGLEGVGTPLGVRLAALGTAAGTPRAIGILQNEPNVGEAAVVRILGTSKAVCSGTAIQIGQKVMADAAGRITVSLPASGTPWNLGVAYEVGNTANDVIEIQLCPHQV